MLLEDLKVAFHTDKPSVKKKALQYGIPSQEVLTAMKGKKKKDCCMKSNLADYIKG